MLNLEHGAYHVLCERLEFTRRLCLCVEFLGNLVTGGSCAQTNSSDMHCAVRIAHSHAGLRTTDDEVLL